MKITTTYAYASTVLFPYICDFSKLYSNIKVDLMCNDRELDLTKREADVSIRPYDPNATDLEQIFLYERTLKLFASKKYLENVGTPHKLEDLDTHRFVIFNESSTTIQNIQSANWILTLGMRPGQKREPSIKVNSAECLAYAAQEGLGIIALSNDSLLIEKHNLSSILPSVQGPCSQVCYTYPTSVKNLQIIKLFGKYLKEVFTPKAYQKP